jgi:CheY-like chemotaxis protein
VIPRPAARGSRRPARADDDPVRQVELTIMPKMVVDGTPDPGGGWMREQRSILLVEDDDDDLELTLRALRPSRVADRVDVVRDGAEALDYLFATGSYAGREVRDAPDLVLLDLELPNVGGLEVLERLRADPRTCRLPVVILTSSNVESGLARSYDLGANSYVRKPVRFTRFTETVDQLGL